MYDCGALLAGAAPSGAKNNGKTSDGSTANTQTNIADQESQAKILATEGEVVNDPNEFIDNLEVYNGANAIKSDGEVKEAVEQIRNSDARSNNDIVSTSDQREFINRIKKKLHKPLKKLNDSRARKRKGRVELFMSVSQTEGGDFIILDAGLAPQGASFSPPNSTEFIAHYHHQGLERRPSGGDHSPVKGRDLVNFTITLDKRGKCCSVYEVGRQSGRYVYRQVKSNSSVGNWKEHPSWNDD